jgi:parallel beta helix pectate lyase-like protein
MPKVQVASRPLVSLAVLLLVSSQASAQATRTWVSGVGDDVNPCSRTAPCKTFAGAISKTADGGEINCIDSGGFGAVTITKSVTIDGAGVLAGILAGGTNGVIINDTTDSPNSVVTLRNLSINGGTATAPGINGIRFLAGGKLHVENCTVFNFAQCGISIEPSPAGAQTFDVFVLDTVIRNCATTANKAGILVLPGANGTVNAMLDGVRMNENHTAGLRAEARTNVTVRNSEASDHANFGFVAVSSSAATPAIINMETCVATRNGTVGVNGTSGVRSAGAGAIVRMSNVMVVNNINEGLSSNVGATILSFGNNRIAGNPTNGAPTATQAQQ